MHGGGEYFISMIYAIKTLLETVMKSTSTICNYWLLKYNSIK